MPTSQSSPAFLSVRLPQATRDRLKVAAAARGETMQGLVGSLVERFLAEEPRAPDLATVLGTLRVKTRPTVTPTQNRRMLLNISAHSALQRGHASRET